MRTICSRSFVLAGLVGGALSAGVAHAGYFVDTPALSGTYDEKLIATNQVDRAVGARTLDQVKADVVAAAAAGTGGVYGFDSYDGDPKAVGHYVDEWNFHFGTNRWLQVIGGDARTPQRGATTIPGSSLPISGAHLTSSDQGTQDFQIVLMDVNAATNFKFSFASPTLDAIGGAAAPEVLSEVGITLLNRTGSGTDTATVKATFSDGTSQTLTADFGLKSAKDDGLNADDTYFGFVAPAGKSVTALQWSSTSRILFMDDMVMITSPVPEPASLGLLALGGLALLRRRRA